MLTGFTVLRSTLVGRWFGVAGIAVGVAGWVGAFRNVTNLVEVIAEMNNYTLMLIECGE